MRKPIITIALLLLAGCSTIENRTYFSPNADPRLLRGPEEPACALNFGGLPDTFVFKIDDKDISLKAYQNFHPYFWGPMSTTVVPVFPLTWLIEPFVSDELSIHIAGDKKTISDLKKEDVSISFSSGNDTKSIQPEAINFNGHSTTIIFSADYNSVEAFKLHISGLGQEKREVDVPFIKTNRWSWTEWTPNCWMTAR